MHLGSRELSAAVATLALGSLGAAANDFGSDDPIHAAIQAHWLAEQALGEVCDQEPQLDAPKAERDAWCAAQDTAGDAEFDAQWAILDVEPTTVAGVIALLDYIVSFRRNGWREFCDRGLEDHEKSGTAGDRRGVSFEDDAMRFAAKALVRLTGAKPANASYLNTLSAARTV